MTAWLRSAMAAACVLVAAGQLSAQPADQPSLLLAGSDQALWLVRVDQAKAVFDLCVRKQGGSWRWVEQGLSGKPAVAAASDELLHLFFRDTGDYLTFGPQRGERSVQYRPRDANWPDRQPPLSLCAGPDREMFALVARPPAGRATRPAAATASGPEAPATTPAPATGAALVLRDSGPRKLALFHRPSQRWRHLLDIPSAELAAGESAAVAYAAHRIYVMAYTPSAPADAATLLVARWPLDANKPAAAFSPVQTANLPSRGRIIGMVGMGRHLIVAVSLPSQAGQAEVALCTLAADGNSWIVRPVASGDKPHAWLAGQTPLIAAQAEQVAFVWKDDKAFQFGMCNPATGALVAMDAKGVFTHQPLDEFGTAIQEYFVWIIAIVVLLPLLVFRPRGTASVFAIPDNLRPAHLGKRLLAALVDFLPFHLAGSAIIASFVPEQDLWDMLRESKHAFTGEVSTALAIEFLAALTAYVIYGAVMETLTGTTIGKRLVRLRVVGFDGSRPDVRSCIVRNVFKFLEGIMPIPWIFIPIFTRYRQRMGDMFAHTAVVEEAPPAVETKHELGPLPPEQRPSQDEDNKRPD